MKKYVCGHEHCTICGNPTPFEACESNLNRLLKYPKEYDDTVSLYIYRLKNLMIQYPLSQSELDKKENDLKELVEKIMRCQY
jgi:predicted nucleic acid-binding Zn ribbon protein